MITVRFSPNLLHHLETFEVDGATVASVLFEGGRLSYPGRKEIEHTIGSTEPYTLEHEARVIDGFPSHVQAAIRVLSKSMGRMIEDIDPTLELLWETHAAYIAGPDRGGGEISLDRLVAALVMVQTLVHMDMPKPGDVLRQAYNAAAETVIAGLESVGFPPNSESLEELFDGAPPACVGLGLIDIDWKGN